ncbi:DUF2312 domain-containing protein [Ferrimonas balearica]|nr:DUF2312 domain-containing protein [Ferrimonas balearica]
MPPDSLALMQTDITRLLAPVPQEGRDELLDAALAAVVEHEKASTSWLQRQFGIGYNRASAIIETLETLHVISPADALGKRHVRTPSELRQALGQNTPAGGMKETDADREVRDKAYRVTAGELRSFIERFERLDAEKKDIADQQKEVMAEAKGRGYDTKVLRKIIALRKREPDDIAEEEAVLEMYKEALGMG